MILRRARGWMCSRKIVSLPVSLMETDLRQEKNLARWRSSQLLSTLLNLLSPICLLEEINPFSWPIIIQKQKMCKYSQIVSLLSHITFFSTLTSQFFFVFCITSQFSQHQPLEYLFVFLHSGVDSVCASWAGWWCIWQIRNLGQSLKLWHLSRHEGRVMTSQIQIQIHTQIHIRNLSQSLKFWHLLTWRLKRWGDYIARWRQLV